MVDEPQPDFVIAPSPDHPGWVTFDLDAPDRYNAVVLGPLIMRKEASGACRVRCLPRRHLTNAMGAMHGGALLGLIDVSLFAALHLLTNASPKRAVTVDLATQFVAPGRMDQPVDAVVELLRETGRLAFLRGVVEQGGTLVSAFNGTLRKASPPR